MVHAFIFGSNIFITSRSTVSYVHNGERTDFINILAFFKCPDVKGGQVLTIDASFGLPNGERVMISNNERVTGKDVYIVAIPKRVTIHHLGTEMPVLDIFQLDEETYHGFGTHIAKELEARQPDVTVTIKGHLVVAGTAIWMRDDALMIGDTSVATGVVNAHHGVILSPDGISYDA